jgi:murein tripeptide amidase MpaA
MRAPWPVAAVLVLVTACAPDAPGSNADVHATQLVSAAGEVAWDRYHTNAETIEIMRAFEALHPELARVFSIGESFAGQDLMVMEITNPETGPAHEKPALYLDGGIHAQELTSSEVALYVMAHLLNGYGSDPQVTELLDTRTFYIRPKFNPDGSDLVLTEDQWLRSTPRPVDLNGDGIPDSDPPEDLDGDGWILQMLVPDPEGDRVRDADDPRIVRARQEGDEGPFYRLEREGRDLNGDGIINSDGIGGMDMNRNFPYNWAPTYRQPGSYNFPLSEPETWAAANFVNDHPNITQIVHGHTSGGFIYRLPSASNPEEFDITDLALIEELGAFYTEDTGRPVRPSATHPVDHRYGTFISMGYDFYGIIGWVPEYWPGPSSWVPDYEGTGEVTEADWHRANDEEFDGRYFTDWTPFDHPEMGEVLIGGWHTKYWSQNPPMELLEEELRTQVPWILHLAERSPLIRMGEPVITELGDDRFRIEVEVTNEGYQATHLTQRGHHGREVDGELRDQIIRPILAILEGDGVRVTDGHDRRTMGHLAGTNPYTDAVTERTRTVAWEVEREAPGATVRLTIDSAKGGVVRSGEISLP